MPDFPRRNPNNGSDPSLPEINYTDQLLDALAGERPVYPNDAGESELTHLLAGWRDEVRQAPLTATVTPRDAALALDRATAPAAPPRRRLGLAVAGSVAAAVLCLGGFGSVIYGAGPGDALYNLRTMFFGEQEQTRDDQVALAAQSQLAQVQQLIDQGDWAAAQDRLQTITTTVAAVNDTSRQQELVDQWQELSVKVESRDINATVPPDAPPVVLPEVPSDLPLPALLSPDSITSTSPVTISSPSTSPVTSSPDSATSATPSPSVTTSPAPSPSTTPAPTPTTPTTTAPTPTTTATPVPTPSSPAPVTTTTSGPVAAPSSASSPTSSAEVTLSTTTVVPTSAPTTAAPTTAAPTTTAAPATQEPEPAITTTTEVPGLPG
ncbi:anti-sigma-D factor RsdA [Mycobacterium sp. WMMD1722]|uniref:anti-sigma-D factor RsdA n=1 Tax=Mycobacterium sp. WMMD1722 TaxID=3404117 RepID=UPI003BF50E64